MSGPENTFIASVHKHLPPVDDFYRMKNHNEFNSGIADVWYSGKSDLWVESKFIAVPVRDATVIDLRVGSAKTKPPLTHLQQEWLRRRHAEGRSVGVIVGSKAGGVWFPGVSWDTAYTAKEFRGWLLTRQGLAAIIKQRCL